MALLQGTTKEAQAFLVSGNLIKAILESIDEADITKGLEFKDAVDFLSGRFMDTVKRLKKSAPDLKDKLEAKIQKPSPRRSPKAMKEGQEHSS